ncbi:hypothetical protein [Nocardioides bruguierae]|uniref:Uncharacterized protein n=1 Tax=Nocardioides bruguierae TaxID=2945102 RepID=A0A9X2D5L2_9ACTN|nr:hypothetical protein [Nocardioides bruguierae]MCM0619591.1 hypothetical protein [Nocardioides bruguierae]
MPCPPWCTRSQEFHAAELLNNDWDGRVIHQSRLVADWTLSSITWPDGTPSPEDGHGDVVVVTAESTALEVAQAADLAWALVSLIIEAQP